MPATLVDGNVRLRSGTRFTIDPAVDLVGVTAGDLLVVAIGVTTSFLPVPWLTFLSDDDGFDDQANAQGWSSLLPFTSGVQGLTVYVRWATTIDDTLELVGRNMADTSLVIWGYGLTAWSSATLVPGHDSAYTSGQTPPSTAVPSYGPLTFARDGYRLGHGLGNGTVGTQPVGWTRADSDADGNAAGALGMSIDMFPAVTGPVASASWVTNGTTTRFSANNVTIYDLGADVAPGALILNAGNVTTPTVGITVPQPPNDPTFLDPVTLPPEPPGVNLPGYPYDPDPTGQFNNKAGG